MTPFYSGSTTRLWTAWLPRSVLLVGLVVLTGACQRPQSSVQSYLEGRIVVDSSEGTPTDFSDFRVLVLRPDGRQIDTLGHARTDREGHFRMTIRAPTPGIYPLSLWGRNGRTQLSGSDYVVAAGDSAVLNVELPLQHNALHPESPENKALRAYRNTMSMHRRMLTGRLRDPPSSANAQVQNVRLTSSTLWSLRDRYPGTYAAEFAAVESLSLLAEWNDSLVVARARQIPPSSSRYLDALRIARRAEARRHGHRAALALVDSFQVEAATPLQQAGAKAVRIQAFLDSLQFEAAYSSAQRLKADHPHTQWAEWARRVQYESKHLLPGLSAPNLTLQTLRGDTLTLQDLRGRPVILEYYRPGADLYTLQQPLRNALYETTRPDSVAFISVSVEPDSLVNRIFLQNQRLPGLKVIASDGREDPIVTKYNVVDVPIWVLIDGDGTIVNQYRASALPSLRQDLTRLLAEKKGSAASTPPASPLPFPGGSFTESEREGLETGSAIRVLGSYQAFHQRSKRAHRPPSN